MLPSGLLQTFARSSFFQQSTVLNFCVRTFVLLSRYAPDIWPVAMASEARNVHSFLIAPVCFYPRVRDNQPFSLRFYCLMFLSCSVVCL